MGILLMHLKYKCECNGYVTNVILQVPSEVSGTVHSHNLGTLLVELATSGFPSATTTNYAKEKLAIQ